MADDSPWRSRIVGSGDEAPDRLVDHPRNPKVHPTVQQKALTGALGDLGWLAPVIVNRTTGHLIDGHLRTALARQRHEPTVPVIYVELSEAEEAEALLTFDPIGNLAGHDKGALDGLLREIQSGDESIQKFLSDLAEQNGLTYGDETASVEAPDGQVDRAEELRVAWGTTPGQIWEAPSLTCTGKGHRLLCGDSSKAADVVRLFGAERAEMVWTDPPYGVAVGDKNKYLNSIARSNRVEQNLANDTLDEPALAALIGLAFDHAMAHCLAGAAWYVAAPARPLHVLFGQALKDRGIWRQTIQWVKNNATFAPLGVDYHWRAEPIFYGWLPNAAHRFHGGRKQDTVWEIDRPQKSPEHPTMKPVALVARAITNSSTEGELVYDAFLGSGTTMVAAEQSGRICYGIEIDPGYTAVSLQRLADLGLEPRLVEA